MKLLLNNFLVKKKYIFSILFFFILRFWFAQDLSNISLNGKWQVIYDYDNKSGSHNIDDIIKLFDSISSTIVNVPSCLESQKKDFEGVALYKKNLFLFHKYGETEILKLHLMVSIIWRKYG